MEHVVFFPAHDGSPAFRRVASLEDAVRLVEHLRNAEGVTEVSVHALTEVPLSFKAVYRVEIPGAAPAVEAPATAPVAEAPAVVEAPAPVVEAPVEAPALLEAVADLPEQPVPALASSNGHAPQASGPSSLGFFSR